MSKINLLRKKEESLNKRILYFTTHYLRYILVITQLVIIVVFFYRLKVDQEVVDLSEAVKQKEEIITVSYPLLQEAKLVDRQIGVIKNVAKKEDFFLDEFNYITHSIPEGISLKHLSFNKEGVNVKGSALTAASLEFFYKKMREDGKFCKVNLKGVNKKMESIEFEMLLSDFNLNRKCQ